jgi:hypothetical protein
MLPYPEGFTDQKWERSLSFPRLEVSIIGTNGALLDQRRSSFLPFVRPNSVHTSGEGASDESILNIRYATTDFTRGAMGFRGSTRDMKPRRIGLAGVPMKDRDKIRGIRDLDTVLATDVTALQTLAIAAAAGVAGLLNVKTAVWEGSSHALSQSEQRFVL